MHDSRANLTAFLSCTCCRFVTIQAGSRTQTRRLQPFSYANRPERSETTMTSCCQSSPRRFSTESASKQTGCSTSKCIQAIAGQLFPDRGVLAENLDTPLAVLRRTIPTPLQEFPVFAYIVKTVKFTGRQFVQLGSGPNFQGDCITLCTCKPICRGIVMIVRAARRILRSVTTGGIHGCWLASLSEATFGRLHTSL